MRKGQRSKRNQKPGRKKQRRNRRFWRKVTADRYQKIMEIARRFTKNIADAEDLAQVVVFRLLKYCPKPVRIINLDAYIWASTRHAFLDSRRTPRTINFSELKRTDTPRVSGLDPAINQFMAKCELAALEQKINSNDTELLRIKILVEAGYRLPEIADLLGIPIRRVKYRWYGYRQAQRKTLQSGSSIKQ